MRSRLLTLVLLAVLGWFLYDIARTADESLPPPAMGSLLYPGLETRDVDFVSLRFRTGHTIDLERDEGGFWWITDANGMDTVEMAQKEYVEVLLDNLSRATVIPVEEQGGAIDPATVGLGDRCKLVVFGNESWRRRLDVGEREALGQGVYARRDDGRIVLATPNILTMLEQFRSEDYVDKHLLRGLRGPPHRIRVERPGGVLLDARLAADRWVLTEPVSGQADTSRIKSLVRGLQFVQQMWVAGLSDQVTDRIDKISLDDGMLAELGLPTRDQVALGDWAESTMIELSAPGETPVRCFLERDWRTRDDEMFAVRGDVHKLLVVDRNEFNLLTNDTDFFRERSLLPPIRERARRLRIERGDDVLVDVAAGRQGRWTFVAPERLAGTPVDAERIDGRSSLSDVLGLVDALEASAFADEVEPGGTRDARLTVHWSWAGRERDDVLALWNLAGPTVHARVSSRPGEGLVLDRAGDEALDEALGQLLHPFVADRLRRLDPVDVDRDAWAGLAVHHVDWEQPLTVQRTGDDPWQGDDAWGRRMGLGLDVIRHLRGLAWRPAREVPPVARIVYTGEEGTPLGELALRPPEPDEAAELFGTPCVYARWSGVEDLELAVSADWLERVEALARAQGRTPIPGAGG